MAFNFNIILLLVVLPACSSTIIIGSVLLLFALLLLLLLLCTPNLIDIEKLDSDDITLECTITVLGATDVNVGIKNFGRDVCIRTVAFIDTEDTNDELARSE